MQTQSYDIQISAVNTTPYLYLLCDNLVRINARGGNPSIATLMNDAEGYGKYNNKDVYGFIYKPFGSNPRLFLNNKSDFVIVENFNENTLLSVNALVYNQNNDTSATLDNYLDFGLTYTHGMANFNLFDWELEEYYNSEYNASLTQYEHCVFDYQHVFRNTYVDTQVTRYHAEYFNIVSSDIPDEDYYIHIVLGSQTASYYNEGYTNGYNNGYNEGNNTGYNNGYNDGFNDGQSTNVTQETAHAFSYVKEVFNAVGGFMSIEVLPHITLGTCFSIPLVLILIMTIFKLVRK